MGSFLTKHEHVEHSFDDFYSLTANNIDGEPVDFSAYRNKVVICVNVASEWGKKRQIPAFNSLYEKYKARGLEILFFPCNQFNNQEPGDRQELKKFYLDEMKIPFTLMEKIEVQGKGICDVYRFLRAAKLKNQKPGKNGIEWNYQKYVVGKTGHVIKRYGPAVKPEAFEEEGRLESWLNA